MDSKQKLLELLKQQKAKQDEDTLKGVFKSFTDKVQLMKGDKGDIGIQGERGEQGIQGIQGEKGLKGDTGEKGDSGVKGKTGKAGNNGLDAEPVDEETIISKIMPRLRVPQDGSPDMAEDIRNKLELLEGDERLKLEAISGVEKLRNDLVALINAGILSLDNHRVLGIKQNGTRIGQANEINFIGATVAENGQQGVDVTFTGGSGNPGGLNLQVQYNNGGVFGGISGAVTNGTILNLTNPLIGGATITTSTVNGVTLTTGGSSTQFLDATGAYSTPAGGTNYWGRDAVNGYIYPATLTDKVGIGTITPVTMLQVVDTVTTSPRGIIADQVNTGTQGSRITMRKARGIPTALTTIITGDTLASFTVSGHDGTNYVDSGKILFTSTGTISTGIVPTTMQLQTMTAAGALATAILIDSTQTVNIGTSSQFQVNNVGNLIKVNNVTSNFPSIQGGAGTVLTNDGSGNLNWTTGTAVSGGNGVEFFYTNTTSDISTYKQITTTPQNVAEQDITVTANNNTVLFFAYSSPSTGLGSTSIDAGTWEFDVYAYASLLTLASSIKLDVYSRTTGGTETLLFSVNSGTLSSTVQLYEIVSIQQAFTINPTDRLIVKVSGITANVTNTTIHFVFGGTTHYSNIASPLVTRHNDLAGLQGGSGSGVTGQYYHLTSTEYTGTGTGIFARQDSPNFTTTATIGGVAIPTISSTNTFTNKRITKRVVTEADAASWTPAGDTSDISYQSNSQVTGTLTMNAPSGTPTNGQSLLLKIKSTNVQTFSWNAIYIAGATGALPTTSIGSGKIEYYPFIYDSVNSKWNYTLSISGGY